MYLVECLKEDSDCVLATAGRLKGVFHSALQAFLETLNSHSLQDLLEPREELALTLGIPLKAS